MGRDEDRHRGAVSDAGGQGFDFAGAFADLMVGVGQVREAVKASAKPTIPWDSCHPVWFTGSIPLSGGAGTLLSSNLYGPEVPYWWDVRALSVWGFTAGTVTVYRNSVNGEQLGQATTPGQFTWSSQLLLTPQDSLVFGAAGVTGSVFLTGQAIEIETAWLPAYLM